MTSTGFDDQFKHDPNEEKTMTKLKTVIRIIDDVLHYNVDNVLKDDLASIVKTVSELEHNAKETARLTREIDIAINGENATEQASLVDILAQLKSFPVADARVRKRYPLERILPETKGLLNVFTKAQVDEMVRCFVPITSEYNTYSKETLDHTEVSVTLGACFDILVAVKELGLEIPDGYKYLTIDKSGIIYAYINKPYCEFSDIWTTALNGNDPKKCIKLGHFEVNGNPVNNVTDWGDTLTELKDDDTKNEFSLDWYKIPSKYNFVAIDLNGDVWAYTDTPEHSPGLGVWFIKNLPKTTATRIRIFKAGIGTIVENWKNTLIERPKDD